MSLKKWKLGDLSTVARGAGISRAHLTYVLQGRRGSSAQVAKRISETAIKLGYDLSIYDLLYRNESNNPLLKESKHGER